MEIPYDSSSFLSSPTLIDPISGSVVDDDDI